MAVEDRHRKYHQEEHQEGGIDEIPQGSLLPQDPTSHASIHEEGGSDELNLDATQIGDGSVSNTEFEYLTGVTTDVADKDYVDDKVHGLDWRASVLDLRNDPPSTPSDEDRYLVGESPTGDWDGHADEIAIYDSSSSSWTYETPDDGWTVWIEDDNESLVYNGTEWVTMSSTVSHSSLTGLGSDDHTQYLLVNGTRAMSGSLDMGTHNISNVGTVDGIDVSAHDHDGDAPAVPNAGLENDSITISSGNGLSGGGSVALGSSLTLSIVESDIDHNSVSGIGENDHHDAFESLLDDSGTTVSPDGSNQIQIETDNTMNATENGNSILLSTTSEAGVTDHGELDGLGDDDHNQYLLADGTRSMSGDLDLAGNDLLAGSTTIWDSVNTHIPQGRLENDSITINSGTGLSGGGSVSLGNSTTLSVDESDVNHGNLSGLGDDDHSQYLLADGTRNMSGDLNLDSYDILNVGTINPDTLKVRLESGTSEPSLVDDELVIWEDTDTGQIWLGVQVDGNKHYVELTG